MDMRETIKTLRTIILEEMAKQRHNTYRFSSGNISEKMLAKHPGGDCSADNPKYDKETWESYLYIKDNIRIILSFNKGRQNARTNPAIILHENKYSSVSVFIYDCTQFDINSSKQDACNALEEFLNKGNTSCCYKITRKAERAIKDSFARKSKTKAVGHVLDLTIRNEDKKIWDIGSNLSKDQIEKASAELVKKIVATLNDLLPVAEYYAKTFLGKI